MNYFKSLLLSSTFVLSVVAAPPKWVSQGAELLEGDSVTRPYITGEKSVSTHDPALVSKTFALMDEIQTSILPEKMQAFYELQGILGELSDHKQFSYEMFAAFHFKLADMVSTQPGPIDDISDPIRDAIQALLNNPEAIPNAANLLHNFLHEKNTMRLAPFLLNNREEAIIGVKTALTAYFKGVSPVMLLSHDAGVHGGSIKNPFDFMAHDKAHADLFFKLFHENPVLSPLRSRLEARVAKLSGETLNEQRELMQIFFFVHELSANYYFYANEPDFSTWQEYQAKVMNSLEASLQRSKEEYYMHVVRQQIEDLKKDEKSCTIVKNESIERLEEGVYELTLGEGSVYKYPTGEIVSLFPGNKSLFRFKKNPPNPLMLEVKGTITMAPSMPQYDLVTVTGRPESYEVAMDNFKDYAFQLRQVGLVPSHRNLKRNPLSPDEIITGLRSLMDGFDPTI